MRYAWRRLIRTPAFTGIAVLTLALGIAATTTFFSIVDAIAFRPVGIAALDRISVVKVLDKRERRLSTYVTFDEFQMLERRLIDDAAAVASVTSRYSRLLQIPGRAEYDAVERVTGGYQQVFDLQAQAGRWISDDDNNGESGENVVVISDRMWREWFGADPKIVGRAVLKINRTPHTIVGVSPPAFHGTSLMTEAWIPAGHPKPAPVRVPLSRGAAGTTTRLESPPATTFVRARANVPRDRLEAQILGALSGSGRNQQIESVALGPATDVLFFGQLRTMAWVVVAFAGLVFAAACANLGNMTYARGTQRVAEIGVRLALGATRSAVFRMFLAEAAVIATAAATLGLVLSLGGLHRFSTLFPALRFDRFTRATFDLSPNSRMFVCAVALGAIATIVVGCATAWRLSRLTVARSIAGGSNSVVSASRGQRTRTTLVAVQVTAALISLLVAGLFLENTSKALDRQLHYDATGLVSARVRLSMIEYTESQSRAFFDQLLTSVRKMPAVDDVAMVTGIPGAVEAGPRYGMSGLVADDPTQPLSGRPRRYDVYSIQASPRFLATAGISLRRGRDLIAADAEGAMVALISESAADALWPGQDPIGKHLKCCGNRNAFSVVGVFADPVDSSDRTPQTRLSNFVITPMFKIIGAEPIVILRSKTPVAQIDALRAAIGAIDPDAPVFDASTVEDILLNGVAGQRSTRWLFTTLGALALGIAVLGIYGVVTYFVSQRTREFGVRLALGATPHNVLKMVLDYTIHVMLVGLLPAVFIASVATRLLEHNLTSLMPNSIAAWVQTPIAMLVAGVAAGLWPAMRAANVDPNVALREL
jgi:putative ABC transport system permease protein